MLDQDHAARLYDGSLDEPGQTQTHEDIKHIGPNSIAHCHVTMTLLDNTHSSQCIRNTDSSSNEGETHDSVRDAKSEADDSDHPDHDIAVQTNPSDRDQEREHKPINVVFTDSYSQYYPCYQLLY